MEMSFISTPMQSVVPSQPFSCGMNTVFVAIIPPIATALSPSREVLYAEVPLAVVCSVEVPISSTGGGEQVGGHDADTDMPQDVMTFTPMRLEVDKLAPWLQAAWQHSSWKGCMLANTSWDATAEK